MNEMRMQEIVMAILADLTSMGTGPSQNVPVKTLLLRAWKSERTRWGHDEFMGALEFGKIGGLWNLEPGGIAGMGSMAMTDAGYAKSRE